MACCVLHNIAKQLQTPIPAGVPEAPCDGAGDVNVIGGGENVGAAGVRQDVANLHFQ